MKFEGVIVDGQRTGFGRVFYRDGLVEYSGGFEGGERSGRGKSFWRSGMVEYSGDWVGGVSDGQGRRYWDIKKSPLVELGDQEVPGKNKKKLSKGPLRYLGAFKGGVRHGKGTAFYKSGLVKYTGGWKDGVKHGTGNLYDCVPVAGPTRVGQDDALVYSGCFCEDKFHGQGELYHANGRIMYLGIFLKGVYHGEGVIYHNSGFMMYEGGFINGILFFLIKKGQFHGKGKGYHPHSNIVQYSGDFKYGLFNGIGEVHALMPKKVGDKELRSGLYYKGGFVNNAKEGIGKIYYPSGKFFPIHIKKGTKSTLVSSKMTSGTVRGGPTGRTV